jgi:hypothetical protein
MTQTELSGLDGVLWTFGGTLHLLTRRKDGAGLARVSPIRGP